MPPRFWISAAAWLGGAYVASLVAMLVAGDVSDGGRALAVTAALCLTLVAVTAAVVRTVRLARPFDPPRRRPALVLSLTPAALVVVAAVLALVGVEIGLGLLWLGLLAALAIIAWATVRHGSSTAIAAAALGWWLICGGALAWACGDSLLDPDRALDGAGFTDNGNALAAYLALFAYATLTALTVALQGVVLAAGRGRRRRAAGPYSG